MADIAVDTRIPAKTLTRPALRAGHPLPQAGEGNKKKKAVSVGNDSK